MAETPGPPDGSYQIGRPHLPDARQATGEALGVGGGVGLGAVFGMEGQLGLGSLEQSGLGLDLVGQLLKGHGRVNRAGFCGGSAVWKWPDWVGLTW